MAFVAPAATAVAEPAPPPPPDASTPDASTSAGRRGDIDMAAVPEALQSALRDLPLADMALVLAFFNRKGGHSGQHQIVLAVEESAKPAAEEGDGAAEAGAEEVQILLKLDFEAETWKRVRKRVRK